MEWLQDNAWTAWLGLALVLGSAEMLSLEMTLLMLAIGALAGAATAGIGAPLVLQVVAAALVSAGMLAFVRPSVIKRLHSGPDLRTGTEAIVGTEGFVVGEISPGGGQVKLGGEIWTARPYDDSAVITEGARVQVLEIRGATAFVVEVPQLGRE
jgi:membrane protein implicated in regulation of membrane protease activity